LAASVLDRPWFSAALVFGYPNLHVVGHLFSCVNVSHCLHVCLHVCLPVIGVLRRLPVGSVQPLCPAPCRSGARQSSAAALVMDCSSAPCKVALVLALQRSAAPILCCFARLLLLSAALAIGSSGVRPACLVLHACMLTCLFLYLLREAVCLLCWLFGALLRWFACCLHSLTHAGALRRFYR
jgi:hypothetical protein